MLFGSFSSMGTAFTTPTHFSVIVGVPVSGLKHRWMAADTVSTCGLNFFASNRWSLILLTRGERVESKFSGVIPIDYKKLSPINIL